MADDRTVRSFEREEPKPDDGSPFHVKTDRKAEGITVGNPDTWAPVQTPCSEGRHKPVLDPTEQSIPGHVGYKCANRGCGIGWIVKETQMVNN